MSLQRERRSGSDCISWSLSTHDLMTDRYFLLTLMTSLMGWDPPSPLIPFKRVKIWQDSLINSRHALLSKIVLFHFNRMTSVEESLLNPGVSVSWGLRWASWTKRSVLGPHFPIKILFFLLGYVPDNWIFMVTMKVTQIRQSLGLQSVCLTNQRKSSTWIPEGIVNSFQLLSLEGC